MNAHLLTGRLLLAVGEHDTNVDPSSTMQLVKALIDADKRFDFYIQPGGGHGVGIDETTGEPLDYSSFSLEPPAGLFEHEDEVAPGTWW